MSTEGRAADSVRITRAYNDSLLVEMRLVDAVLPDLHTVLFGKRYKTPIMTTALSHVGSACPDGLAQIARGAAAAGALCWIGDCTPEETERVLDTGADTVVIVKPFADQGLLREKLLHAQAHGAAAVGVDIDHAFSRKGGCDTAGDRPLTALTQSQLSALASAVDVPFVVKGVLSVSDALKCLDAGAQAMVVSHHGGIMDCAVPPLKILPAIARAVRGAVPLFVDCEIADGQDAFKALALGASAAGVGRPVLRAMRAGGAEAVTALLQQMNIQLAHMMARTGSPDPGHIDPNVIWTP